MTDQLSTAVHRATLWTLQRAKTRPDPRDEIELIANVTGPDGAVLRVPAFWDGGETWRFRLSVPAPGTWRIESECSDADDSGLHAKRAVLQVSPPAEDEANPLYRHGPVQVAGRYFAHADGTPFHWLADTWWMLMSERVSWPAGLSRLTDFRRRQGFTAAQVVVGFQPDTTPFDGRDANAGAAARGTRAIRASIPVSSRPRIAALSTWSSPASCRSSWAGGATI